MVGKQGLEPRPPAPRAGALPAAPQTVTSGPPESNRVPPESESGRLPSSSIPIAHVETPGIEPGRRCLQGMPATSASRPHGRRSHRRGGERQASPAVLVLTLWTCQLSSTYTRRWCSQGRQELNPHSSCFGG